MSGRSCRSPQILLTINKLKPYSSWNEFKPLIFYALEKYQRAAHPKAIRRLGLRYINRIEIPHSEVQIEHYLVTFPNIPEPLPQRLNVWMQRSEIPFDGEGMLIIQSGSAREANQKNVIFLLDLDFVSTEAPFSIELAEGKLEVAHKNVGVAFEASITDATRELFKEVG